MNPPFLSIIIPVYNGETTIVRCLESIWSQGMPLDSYEVICVNDCSTDNTVSVIEEQQKEHSNLRLYSNEVNLRAGGSRNRGVREAKGEYILFIDADDYFHPGAVKRMMEYQMQHKLDILMYDFARENEGESSNNLVHCFSDTSIMSGRRFFLANSLPYAPWKYMFRRSLMIDNEIFFEERVSCEDVDWSHRMAFAAKTMKYEPVLLTHYVLCKQSQTSVEYKNPATVFHRLFCGARVYRLMDICDSEEAKIRMRDVARATLLNGVIFLNALATSPNEKARALRQYVPLDKSWTGVLGFAARYPFVYAWLSTMAAPLFRFLVITKRKLLGR